MHFSGRGAKLGTAATEMGTDRNIMFSQNLYEALCQSEQTETSAPVQEDDGTMALAIQRAMETYQRLFLSEGNPSR